MEVWLSNTVIATQAIQREDDEPTPPQLA